MKHGKVAALSDYLVGKPCNRRRRPTRMIKKRGWGWLTVLVPRQFAMLAVALLLVGTTTALNSRSDPSVVPSQGPCQEPLMLRSRLFSPDR